MDNRKKVFVTIKSINCYYLWTFVGGKNSQQSTGSTTGWKPTQLFTGSFRKKILALVPDTFPVWELTGLNPNSPKAIDSICGHMHVETIKSDDLEYFDLRNMICCFQNTSLTSCLFVYDQKQYYILYLNIHMCILSTFKKIKMVHFSFFRKLTLFKIFIEKLFK